MFSPLVYAVHLPESSVPYAALILRQERRVCIIGLHQHIGSGIRDPAQYVAAMSVLLRVALDCKSLLPDLRFVDVGGGIGVPCESATLSPLHACVLPQRKSKRRYVQIVPRITPSTCKRLESACTQNSGTFRTSSAPDERALTRLLQRLLASSLSLGDFSSLTLGTSLQE